MPRLIALDSTISARAPVSEPIGAEFKSACDCVDCFSNVALNQNVEPIPSADST